MKKNPKVQSKKARIRSYIIGGVICIFLCFVDVTCFIDSLNIYDGSTIPFIGIVYRTASRQKDAKKYNPLNAGIAVMYSDRKMADDYFAGAEEWGTDESKFIRGYFNSRVDSKSYGNGYAFAVDYFKETMDDLPFSKFCLGEAYLNGWGIEQNEKVGMELIDASKQEILDYDDTLSLVRWGKILTELQADCYFYDGDYENALEIYKQLASEGNCHAEYQLGVIYYELACLDKDDYKSFEKAIEYLESACDDSFAYAYTKLGDIYFEGEVKGPNYTKALDYYQTSPSSVVVNRRLGLLYLHFDQIDSAYLAFSRNEKSQDPQSLHCLGLYYEYGLGPQGKNLEMAKNYYSIAAESGWPDSMNNLGYMYYRGEGVDMDYETAMDWFMKAADNGSPEAMGNIASMYRYGYGCEPDFDLALSWYEKAAEAGHAASCSHLGKLYFDGKEVEKDYDKALEYFIQGGKLGNDDCKRNMIYMYENALGTPSDVKEADTLYSFFLRSLGE